MSIMIKGIDMPINCTRCPCSNDESRFCRAANEYIPMLGKPDFCPLEEAEERKKGKWISRVGREDCYECSECHAVIEGNEVYWRNNYFCYHCGADMRGTEE